MKNETHATEEQSTPNSKRKKLSKLHHKPVMEPVTQIPDSQKVCRSCLHITKQFVGIEERSNFPPIRSFRDRAAYECKVCKMLYCKLCSQYLFFLHQQRERQTQIWNKPVIQPPTEFQTWNLYITRANDE